MKRFALVLCALAALASPVMALDTPAPTTQTLPAAVLSKPYPATMGDMIASTMTQLVPSLASYALFIVGGVATILGFQGRNRAVTHAWVECKDTKTKVKRDQVQKLASSVDDVRADSGGKWKPDLVVFVAGSGFDPDALNFAREHGFVTYERDGQEFRLVA